VAGNSPGGIHAILICLLAVQGEGATAAMSGIACQGTEYPLFAEILSIGRARHNCLQWMSRKWQENGEMADLNGAKSQTARPSAGEG
jgi:hypothetical protein